MRPHMAMMPQSSTLSVISRKVVHVSAYSTLAQYLQKVRAVLDYRRPQNGETVPIGKDGSIIVFVQIPLLLHHL